MEIALFIIALCEITIAATQVYYWHHNFFLIPDKKKTSEQNQARKDQETMNQIRAIIENSSREDSIRIKKEIIEELGLEHTKIPLKGSGQ